MKDWKTTGWDFMTKIIKLCQYYLKIVANYSSKMGERMNETQCHQNGRKYILRNVTN